MFCLFLTMAKGKKPQRKKARKFASYSIKLVQPNTTPNSSRVPVGEERRRSDDPHVVRIASVRAPWGELIARGLVPRANARYTDNK